MLAVHQSYSARLAQHVDEVRLVFNVPDCAPAEHGWLEISPTHPCSLFRRYPHAVMQEVTQRLKALPPFEAVRADAGARELLLYSCLGEAWIGRGCSGVVGANALAAVSELTTNPDANDKMTDEGHLGFSLRSSKDSGTVTIPRALANLYRATQLLMDASFNPREHELNTDLVCRLHALVGDGLLSDPGSFRTKSAARKGLTYLPADRIKPRLDVLLSFVRTRIDDASTTFADAIAVASVFYSEFLLIHPFNDGNGRVARLLLRHALRRFVFVPFTLLFTPTLSSRADGLDQKDVNQREYGLYTRVLGARNDKKTPPSLLAAYLLVSVENAVDQAAYLLMMDE